MSNVLYFPNLKKPNTGTQVTKADASTGMCLDVFARNTVLDPLYVSGVSGMRVRETRFHDASAAGINAAAGAFVEVGGATAAAFTNTILSVQISYTAGEPLAFRIAASAVAAAALATDNFIVNQGEGPTVLSVALVATDRLWVRSKSATAVAAGYITMNFMG